MKHTFTLLAAIIIANFSKAQTDTTISIQSYPSNSTFAYIMNGADYSTHASSPNMVIADWTSGGGSWAWRSLLRFDMSALPSHCIIDSAFLSVYADPSSISGISGSPTYGTDNATGIYRLTGTWDTTSLTWATQPGFVYTNGDTLAQSTSTDENYLNVNVTGMVKDMIASGNYGFLFKHLQESTVYNSMIFYSPMNYSDGSTTTPRLTIKYMNTTGISNVNNNQPTIDVYPNPASKSVNIKITNESGEQLSIVIMDCVGRTVTTKNINDNSSQVNVSMDLNDYPKGLYFVKLNSRNENIITKKLIVD